MQPAQLSLLLISGILLAACGSGDDSEPPPSTPIYTGLETEAIITAANAAAFVTEMFGVGGTSISLSATDTTDTEDPKPEPYNIRIPLALSASIENINAENVPSTGSLATFYSEIRECTAGTVDYTINVNELDGSFNGSMNYSNCLVDGFVFLGSADVYGEYDLIANQFVSITFDFPWLRASSDSVEYVAANSVSVEITETATTTILEDTVVSIDGRQEVQFQGFTIQVNEDDNGQTLTLSGRFYHPTYGYVTVATVSVLEFTEDLVWPYYGFLTMAGDGSSLRVLVEDQATFTLWVDLDGDGIYDDQGDGDPSITATW